MREAPPSLVLIASEDEWSGRSLATVLSATGFAVLRAFTHEEAVDTARGAQPDAILVDVRLADIDGVDLCRQLRDEHVVGPCTPLVLVMRSPPTRARLMEAYTAGAWDVHHHPIDPELLPLRLGRMVQAKRECDRTRDEGLVDRSTGLYNPRGVARRARELVAECQRTDAPLAFISVAPDVVAAASDADDAHRRLVEQLAAVLARSLRASDAIGHVGRSEFAVVAPATTAGGARRLVERLQAAAATLPNGRTPDDRPVRLHSGVHAVDHVAADAVDPLDMLEQASNAMHVNRSGNFPAQTRDEHGRNDPPRLVP